MRFSFSRTPKENAASPANSEKTSAPPAFDIVKWLDVIENDKAVAAVADNLRPLGDKWVAEFARHYLNLEDKKHIWIIVQNVIEGAKRQRERADAEA
jgi:hypothetical protein